MKKIFTLSLCLILALTFFLGCSQKTFDTPTGMVKASNDAAGYTMFVPDSWTVNETSGISSASAGAETKTTVSAAKVDKGEATDADSYFKSYEEELKTLIPEFSLQGEGENVLVGELGARRYTYTGKLSGILRTYSMVICPKGESMYIISLTTTPDEYDTYITEFERICDEFVIA